jgi:histone H4
LISWSVSCSQDEYDDGEHENILPFRFDSSKLKFSIDDIVLQQSSLSAFCRHHISLRNALFPSSIALPAFDVETMGASRVKPGQPSEWAAAVDSEATPDTLEQVMAYLRRDIDECELEALEDPLELQMRSGKAKSAMEKMFEDAEFLEDVEDEETSSYTVVSTQRPGTGRRHRKVLRDNIQSLLDCDFQRILRRAGVIKESGLMFEELRGTVKVFMENMIRDAVTFSEHERRRIVTVDDVLAARPLGTHSTSWVRRAFQSAARLVDNGLEGTQAASSSRNTNRSQGTQCSE